MELRDDVAAFGAGDNHEVGLFVKGDPHRRLWVALGVHEHHGGGALAGWAGASRVVPHAGALGTLALGGVDEVRSFHGIMWL